ncbi:hypothetical protein PSCICO_37150 [Pseudomonas cichorii]|uniref:hypothetical protein n=1 Tax=Pseudomonas cichorii TaxID=36746 RepID=UPI001A104E40|nr:hypothetical protein [Pseudomonas cichorii]GFM80458.1 hypothetical protein PSCICN_11500 [Pseudomonas cichorii]GFM88316.1 hypothetical protein PSCICO_37150 [Pseudomonas cichorii]
MDIDLSHHPMKNLLLRLSLLLMFIVGTGLLITPGRAEAVNLAECTGTHTAEWSPGLTNTSQTINVSTNSNWSVCVLPLGVSAASAQSFQATFSCQSFFLQTPTITWVINWSDGATSTYAFTAQIDNLGNLNTTITGDGTITDGRYKGAAARTLFTLQNLTSILNNDCNQPSGVTKVSGISKLVISPL